MLRCGPLDQTLAATAKSAMSEFTLCGLSGLVQVRLLLVGHFLAVAVDFLLRCNLRRGSRHSLLSIAVEFEPSFKPKR